ncbi:hypothetical protein [Halobacterium litoreum]|uniref:Envelope protein N-terminal domain-containing protein n=1 Tax=Halobacterium litoreum TaxID=2039234 RepID=A0ABD5NHD3_9EURY|nr:hypothetical protein [Halobacterium litoreum]UHH12420.1 hypothetical protein LT972_09645 [Halobacterium litoreum]
MNRHLRAALALVAGVVLVTSSVMVGVGPVPQSASPVEDASAQAWLEKCKAGPVFIHTLAWTNMCPDSSKALEEADANETLSAIYSSASQQAQNNDVALTSMGNYLEDTQSIALMHGKNEFVRYINGGKTEAEAKIAAQEAIQEYYATKQRQLISQWNTAAEVAITANARAVNTSSVANDTVYAHDTAGAGRFRYKGDTHGNYTLANNETVEVTQLRVQQDLCCGKPIHNVDPVSDGENSYHVRASAPDAVSESYVTLVKPGRFHNQWENILDQKGAASARMSTYANAAWEAYQNGDISTEDMVDPYMGMRQYSPEGDYGAYTQRSLAAMGLSGPYNLSNVGHMNVTYQNTTYSGVLMSDGTPPGGYQVGSTYNASEINGSQFVALRQGGTVKLEGQFTLSAVTRPDGTEVADNETVEYREVEYNVSNASEFVAMQEQLRELQAQINARQQRLRNSGGGGFLSGGLNLGLGLGIGLPVLLIAGGALLLANN